MLDFGSSGAQASDLPLVEVEEGLAQLPLHRRGQRAIRLLEQVASLAIHVRTQKMRELTGIGGEARAIFLGPSRALSGKLGQHANEEMLVAVLTAHCGHGAF